MKDTRLTEIEASIKREISELGPFTKPNNEATRKAIQSQVTSFLRNIAGEQADFEVVSAITDESIVTTTISTRDPIIAGLLKDIEEGAE